MDVEPAGFHAGGPDLISFAVNLSLECLSDGKPEDPTDDEMAAEKRFEAFLTDVQKVEFHLWKVVSTADKFEHVGKIAGQISDPDAPGAVDDLMKWLRDERAKVTARRYWSTQSVGTGEETATVAEAAGAGDRLRAAQAWNAPVGHRFRLTHVLHVPLDKVNEYYVVLPYFGDPGAKPDTPKSDNATTDANWDVTYDAKDALKTIRCRTDLLEKKATVPVDPSVVDDMLTPEGYLIVDPDADNLRRVTRWFEDRAASLMATAPAFAERPDEDAKSLYGQIFLPTFENAGDGKLYLSARGAAWRIVAGLCATLDGLLIGMLKPSHADASDDEKLVHDANEGEILAPLVTAVLQALETRVAHVVGLDPKVHDARTTTRALRAVIQQSPLAQRSPQQGALVEALRYVHHIDPSKEKVTIAEEYLDALLRFYVGYPATPIVEVSAALKSGIEGEELPILSRIMADADQRLQDEAGAEAAILRVIETSGTIGQLPALFAVEFLKQITGTKPPQSDIEAAFAAGWSDYRSLLEGAFNGAEAVRRSAGSDFTRALLAHAADNPPQPDGGGALPGSSVHAGRLIRQAAFYGERLFDDFLPSPDSVPGCFDALAKRNLAAPVFHGTNVEKSVIWLHLAAAYVTAMAPLDTVLDPAARFIPDAAPQPLPIQIAANIDGANVDEFAKHLNGIAVAIRRIDSDDETDPWAHANFAHLTWDTDDDAATKPEKSVVDAIHPMLPAVSDGRGPMFIDYEGFPFASSELDSTRIADAAATGPLYRPFYRHRSTSAPGFELVPRLAYGRKFESFAFVTSNAGTLPPSLQGPTRPWKPRAIIAPPAKDAKPKVVAETDYSRRTAIGQMAMIESPAGGAVRRLGAPIAGVMPLAGDYPRVGLFAEPQAPGVRDIFREPDGRGTLVVRNLNAVTTTNVSQLRGIRFAGKPSRLSLRLFDGAAFGPDAPGVAAFAFPQKKGGGAEEKNAVDLLAVQQIDISIEAERSIASDPESLLNVKVKVTCGEVTPEALVFETNSDSLWLRVELEAENPSARMSFAEPEAGKPNGAPLLLLAPKPAAPKTDPWKPGLSGPVKLTVHTPRVGYLDFERWIANGRLRQELFKTDEKPEENPSNDTFARRLERALLAAYVMRHLDEKVAAALDRLPDPAVEKVRIELSVLDQLVQGEAASIAREVDLRGVLLAAARTIEKEPPFWSPARLRELFDEIEKRFSFAIEIAPAKGGQPSLTASKTGWVATVPAGMVVQLSTDALVAAGHFVKHDDHPSVLHPGLLQYAPRRVSAGHMAFPSAAVRVETMLDAVSALKANAIKLASMMISARPVGRSRRYDIVANEELRKRLADDELTALWRLTGEIDVISQRWRPSGRPIYHHVVPKQYRADGKTGPVLDPALPVRLPKVRPEANTLALFEAEAFFDRPDIDAQTATQRLLPLPGPTVLQQHFWDAPSATWFRHRFTLRSRYAGALRNLADREAQAWPGKPETDAHAWTMRVAMLADLSRILLTRPQLRALIPLTTAPGADDAKRPAPPVLGVLQEPPFARGGLADRIGAEIKTGFGYGFEPGGETVEILDSRKEIGPTPYLSYRAMEASTALGMTLMPEGPIGLTFDQVNASAPAFPNSLLTLSPIGVGGGDPLGDRPLEEHFLGVSLRRHIDPDWTTEQAAPGLELDAEQCWWIDVELGSKASELLSFAVRGGKPVSLLWINDKEDEKDKDAFVIRTLKAVVDGGIKGTAEHDVKIARLWRGFSNAISILHQPIAPGRYSTSVFAIPKTDWASTVTGRSNVPLMLASIEWSPPKQGTNGADKDTPVMLVAPSGANARATIASAPTFLAWTRTGRDFDFVHLAEQRQPKGAEKILEGEQARITQLVAMLTSDHKAILLKRGGTDGRPAWLTSSTFLSEHPLHVHRHLAVLTTRYLDQPGRPIETFCRSAVLAGVATALTDPVTEEGDVKETKEKPEEYPAEDCVRVVEFETPATILCATDPSGIPRTYQKAYFDLIATGFKPGKDKGALRLLVRCVGSAPHLRKFKSLSIYLENIGADARKFEVNLDNNADDFTKAVELRIETVAGNPSVRLLRASGRTKDGTFTSSKEPFTVTPPDDARPGFFITLEAKGGSGEFWADVSLLHSQAGAFPGAFDFNWLFAAVGGAEPAIDVAPQGLHRMVEAQARIVTVSPPIPIVSHKEPPP
jgi:hypothetical protein